LSKNNFTLTLHSLNKIIKNFYLIEKSNLCAISIIRFERETILWGEPSFSVCNPVKKDNSMIDKEIKLKDSTDYSANGKHLI